MMTAIEKLVFLRKVDLLRALDAEQLLLLGQAAREESREAGSVLFEEGDPGDEMYIVVSGELAILAGERDQQRELARLQPGEILGEMALFDDEPRSAKARVGDSPARLLALRRQDVEALVLEHPPIALTFLKEMVQRVRAANRRAATEAGT